VIRSLRKGQTSIEVWYKYGEDSLGAKQTEIQLMGDHAVFRIKLAPVDGNQSYDANKIFLEHSHTITKVIIRDNHIRKNTAHFLNAYADQISHVNLELVHNQSHIFSSSLKALDNDGLEFQIKI
jgi:hypothetical protein